VQAGFVVGGDRTLGGADPQGDRVAAIAERARRLAETGIAQRLERRVIEALGLGDITDAKGDVVDHGRGFLCGFDRTNLTALASKNLAKIALRLQIGSSKNRIATCHRELPQIIGNSAMATFAGPLRSTGVS
jgi:hypothetical protein